jgi:sulfur carrier protein
MEITLNGEPKELPEGLSAQGLIELLGLSDKRLAIEINATIVPRSRLAEQPLRPGDRVEIVHAIGGG